MSATLFPAAPAAMNALPQSERDALVLSCLRLCRRLARDHAAANPAHEADDLEQEALLCCVEAAKRWNPDAGTRFSTYATACVKRHLAGVVTAHRGEGVVRLDSWDAVTAPDRTETAEPPPPSPRTEYLIARLREPARSVVTLVVVEGLDPTRAADRLGMPVKDVKLVMRNAARELEREAVEYDKPGLFDLAAGPDWRAEFARLLAEVEAELVGDAT